eukprot:403368516
MLAKQLTKFEVIRQLYGVTEPEQIAQYYLKWPKQTIHLESKNKDFKFIVTPSIVNAITKLCLDKNGNLDEDKLESYAYLADEEKIINEITSIVESHLILQNPYLLIDANMREFTNKFDALQDEIDLEELKYTDKIFKFGLLSDQDVKFPDMVFPELYPVRNRRMIIDTVNQRPIAEARKKNQQQIQEYTLALYPKILTKFKIDFEAIKSEQEVDKVLQETACITYDQTLELYKIKIFVLPLDQINRQRVNGVGGFGVGKKLAFESEKYLRRRAQIEEEITELMQPKSVEEEEKRSKWNNDQFEGNIYFDQDL